MSFEEKYASLDECKFFRRRVDSLYLEVGDEPPPNLAVDRFDLGLVRRAHGRVILITKSR